MTDSSPAYGSLPFKDQITFFRAKRNVLTESWTDLWEAEHDHGFMVAGANRIDLLVDLRAAVDKAIADGTGLRQFRKDFDTIVEKHGWQYNGGRNWRTRVIFETNLRTSYAAGRYAQLQELKQVRPYWRYRHSDAVMHPRPQHLAWDGLVLHADDPWWNTHFPPNGWGCQCTVEALNARDLAKLGKSGPDTAPALNLETVTVGKNGASPHTVQVPAGIDPGFGYAPGKSAYAGERPGPASTPAAPATARVTPIEPAVFDRLAQDLLNKATRLPAGPGAQALADVLERPRVQQALDEAYTAARTGLQQTAPPADAPPLMVGALNAAQVQAMTRVGLNPTAAPIGAALGLIARSALATLPRLLRSAQAVLLDALTSELLYVQGAADAAGTVQVATVRVGTGAAASNTYASDGRLSLAYLRQQVQGGQLQLIQGTL